MTRNGSLAYYLVAIVVGCFFMAVCDSFVFHVLEKPEYHWSAQSFLSYYAASLLLGCWTALLFAFVLRRLTAALRLGRSWQWLVAGAVVSPGIVWSLGWGAQFLAILVHQGPEWQTVPLLLIQMHVLMAPTAIVGGRFGTWEAAAAGAATAVVLLHIHRAFEPRAESESAPGSRVLVPPKSI
jgi:hypothetical protein